jgi:hypothetical protein
MNSLGPGGTQQIYDFSKSNLVLMIGGQLLIIMIALIVVFFGTPAISFPKNSMKSILKNSSSR